MFLYLNNKPKRYSEIEYQVYEDDIIDEDFNQALKTLKQKMVDELRRVFIPVNQITFESENKSLKDGTPR